MDEVGRKAALRQFLFSARERLAPQPFGIVAGRRRRARGLRREEVAELAGISEAWYTRFETGRVRASFATVDRVANVLGLRGPERERLIVLARPEFATVSAGGAADAWSGSGTVVTHFAAFVRDVRRAGSVREIADATALALHKTLGADSFGYVRRLTETKDALVYESASGLPACEVLVGYAQSTETIRHVESRLRAGAFVEEPDLTKSPSAEIRDRVAQFAIRSYRALPICVAEDEYAFIVGSADRKSFEASPEQREVVETIAAVAELALT